MKKILSLILKLDITKVASEQYYNRGLNYFKTNSLLSYSWNGEVLNASINGSEIYKVKLLNEIDDNIIFICNCPLGREKVVCKHIICALIGVKAFLQSKEYIPENYYDSFEISRFKNQLDSSIDLKLNKQISDAKNSSKYKIILHTRSNSNQITFTVTNNNIKIDRSSFNYPSDLEKLFKSSNSSISFQKLFNFILQNPQKYELSVQTSSGLVNTQFNQSLILIPKTEFNLQESKPNNERESANELNKISIRKLGFYNNKLNENFIVIGENFLDIPTQTIGSVSNNEHGENWYYADNFSYNSLNNFYKYDNNIRLTSQSFDIKIEDFISSSVIEFEMGKENLLDNFIFKVNDHHKDLIESNANFKVIIKKTHNEKLMLLECLLQADSYQNILLYEDLNNFIENGFTNLKNPKPKDKRIFVDGILKLILAQTKEDINFIKETTISKIGDVNINQIYNQFIDFINTKTIRILPLNNSFHKIALDRKELWRSLAIINQIFSQDIDLSVNLSSILIPTNKLYNKLSILKTVLSHYNIDLLLENKKIKLSKFEFNIDATNKLGIDWFELNPEIRLDEKLISRENQNELLDSGIIERDDFIQILDVNSQQIMKILFGNKKVDEQTNSNKTNKREITELSRLRIFDLIELKQLGVNLKLNENDKETIDSLSNFDNIKNKKLPEKLKYSLRDYQETGYNWLAFLYEHKFGACLADDMGLGKTLQTISFLAGIKEDIIKSHYQDKNPHLIVLPPSLVFNWENEINKFYPYFNVLQYKGANRQVDFKDIDIVLTTYDIARTDIELLKKINFHVIIFDEAQAIKNIYAKRTSSVRQLQGYFKICLTGTPLENHLGEFYSIMDLTIPGLLPSYDTIGNIFTEDIQDFFVKKTKPFVLRRTKETILKELPKKTEEDIYLPMNESQKKIYAITVAQIKKTIDQAYQTQTANKAKILALTAILRLRQICISPALVEKGAKLDSPKINFLLEQIKTIKDSGILVFSQFVSSLDLIENILIKGKIKYLRIDGSTPMAKRKKIVEEFQNHKTIKVLLLSLKTGGIGLNLTNANYVFHLDPWWNPAVENQASDRAHRIGQTKNVFVTRLLMKHSIEEKIMYLKQKKKDLFDAVLSNSTKKTAALNKADFDFLLS